MAGKTIPSTLCPSNFNTLSIAVTISVVVDAILQVRLLVPLFFWWQHNFSDYTCFYLLLDQIYLYFLDWRFKALLEQYFAAKFVQNGTCFVSSPFDAR